jgi:phytoene synthase
MNLALAYRHCEDVTRSRAANFYYGIRLLPPRKRRALCAVYAFARRIDDIGDGSLPAPEQVELLERARASLDLVAASSADPVLAALADARSQFRLPMTALAELIDGVEMDVRGTTYSTFEEVEAYCRLVAGSIGRVSVAVFEASSPQAAAGLADDLGVAMQVTNILRDVREDLARGRVYLPAEDLRAFGLEPDLSDPQGEPLAAMIRFEARRARGWFGRGLGLLPLLDARSASCVSAMTGIYRRILDRLERRPEEALRRRISLPPWEKAWVAARSLAGARS